MENRFKIARQLHLHNGVFGSCCSVVDSFDPILEKGVYKLKHLSGKSILFDDPYQWWGKVQFRQICACHSIEDAKMVCSALNAMDLK